MNLLVVYIDYAQTIIKLIDESQRTPKLKSGHPICQIDDERRFFLFLLFFLSSNEKSWITMNRIVFESDTIFQFDVINGIPLRKTQG